MAKFETTVHVWNKSVTDFLAARGIDGADYMDAEGYSITQVKEITDDILNEIASIVGKRVDAINAATRQMAGIDIDMTFDCEVIDSHVIITFEDNQEATHEREVALNKTIAFDPATGTGLDGAVFGIGQSVTETLYQVNCYGIELAG